MTYLPPSYAVGSEEHRRATLGRLAEGYATNNDRRAAKVLRERRDSGHLLTQAQLWWIEAVDQIETREANKKK